MDFNISTIKDSTQNFTSKAGADVSSSDLTSSPNTDQLSSILNEITPSTTISYNSQGIPQNGSISNLTNTIKSTISKATSFITGAAGAALNSVIGASKIVLGSSDSFYKNIGELENILKIQAQNFSTTSNSQATSILSILDNSLDTATISNSMLTPLDETKSYSPKTIRDLRYPDNYNKNLSNIINKSLSNGTQESLRLSIDSANYNPINNSGQSALTQMGSQSYSGNYTQPIRMKVRRTVYWAQGPGSDADTALYKSATGRLLKQGISVAVDNNVKNGGIAFLSRVVFDDIGERFAVDWGSDVAKRTASKGALPIVDVFFDKREDAERFANSTPLEVFVTVYPPRTKYTYALNSPPTYGLEA